MSSAQKRAPRPKNKKICPVCGKEFYAPPTRRITCSQECMSKHESAVHTGKECKWSKEARTRLKEKFAYDSPDREHRMQSLRNGTAASLKLPEGQRGEQNREAKVWKLISPIGEKITVVNLLNWARQNYELFDPESDNPEVAANNIRCGFTAIASTMRGAPSRSKRGASTYKGWRLEELPKEKDDSDK